MCALNNGSKVLLSYQVIILQVQNSYQHFQIDRVNTTINTNDQIGNKTASIDLIMASAFI